ESGRKGRADRRCSKCFVEYMRAFRIQVVPKQLLHLASAKSYLCVVERVEKGCISDQKMLVNMQQFLEQAGIEVAAAKRRSCAQESSRQGSVRERGRGYQQALLLVGQGEIIRRRMAIYQQYRGAMEIALSMLDTEASFLANFFRLLDEKYDNGAAHHQSSLLQELVPVEGFMQKVICYMERGCPYIGTIIPFFSDAVKAKYGRELSERESYLLRGCLFGRFVKMFFLKIDAAFWDSHDSADESDLIVHLAMFKRAQHLSGRKEPFAKRGMRCLIQILDVIPDEYEEATFTEDMESLCRKVRCHFNTREKKAVLLAEMRGYIQHVQYDFTFPVLSLLRRRLLLRKASLVAAAEGGGGGDGK
ncbi:hypothetical protein K0U07_03870, partial [bacterium]|nr:hypothetical protein [bacterium]